LGLGLGLGVGLGGGGPPGGRAGGRRAPIPIQCVSGSRSRQDPDRVGIQVVSGSRSCQDPDQNENREEREGRRLCGGTQARMPAAWLHVLLPACRSHPHSAFLRPPPSGKAGAGRKTMVTPAHPARLGYSCCPRPRPHCSRVSRFASSPLLQGGREERRDTLLTPGLPLPPDGGDGRVRTSFAVRVERDDPRHRLGRQRTAYGTRAAGAVILGWSRRVGVERLSWRRG
jgi:hypothetical protein